MPELGPDICYSCQEFIALLGQGDTRLEDLTANESLMHSVRTDIVLTTCQECNWVVFTKDGFVRLTQGGQQLASMLAKRDATGALRFQISSMIGAYNWVWTNSLRSGRKEAFRRMPEDAKQVFLESMSLSRWSKQQIAWWDNLSKYQRAMQSELNLEVGRRAEELSFEYEKSRTKVTPDWRALETTFDGYDILSRRTKTDRSKLRIEVKGTSVKVSNAEFSITRHEWQTAKLSGNYVFHLWSLGAQDHLSVVDYKRIEPHVPKDRKSGRWENFKLRFGIFFSDPRSIIIFKPEKKLRTPMPRIVAAKMNIAGQ